MKIFQKFFKLTHNQQLQTSTITTTILVIELVLIAVVVTSIQLAIIMAIVNAVKITIVLAVDASIKEDYSKLVITTSIAVNVVKTTISAIILANNAELKAK